MRQSLIVVAVHTDSDLTDRDGDCYSGMKSNEATATGLDEKCPSPN